MRTPRTEAGLTPRSMESFPAAVASTCDVSVTSSSLSMHKAESELVDGEARGDDDGVVEARLVGGEQHGVGLAEVHVQGRVGGLHGVGALHLHQLHGVPLEPDVQGGCQAHVGDPEPVRPACKTHQTIQFRASSLISASISSVQTACQLEIAEMQNGHKLFN